MRRMHGFTLIALIALLTVVQISAGATEKYHMVIVPNPTDHIMRTIAELGIPLDCGARMIKDQGLELPLSDSEIALLNSRGILYRITQPDLESYYSAICRENMKNIPIQMDVDPVHMKYGSMGGFYTWVQIVADLDSMNLLYSNLAAPKVVIGQGHNSNPVYMVKISDNPGVQETEPEGEFDATIHAREPGSYTSLMYAMWWLLENYGTDQEATYLVNNRQLYFVPVVNPDGFLQNIQTNPGGGGMWRKNRRFNNPSYGVDCNRNFTYQWGYDNSGSSPTPSSETYRGPSAGSEPETQAIMNLITAHNIKVSNSMHTYAGVYLSPYGYAPVLPPVADHQAFMEYMSTACEGGGYNFGPVNSPLMYAVNGGSVDWAYHDRNSIATTVEVGTVSFWPPIGNIFPDAQKNLPGLLYQFWVAGARIEGTDLAVSDGFLTPGQTENLVATIKNQGQTTSESFTYELTETDPYLTITPNVISVDSLQKRASLNNGGNPFAIQVSSTCPAGHGAVVSLVIHQGSYTRTQNYTLAVGAPTVLFSDNGESGMGNWTASGGWALTTSTSHSPSNSFADSPTGNYSSSTTRYLTLTQNLNLSGVTAAWLDFWTRWEIEGGWDFAQLEVSTNNGTTWTAIPGNYTTLGTGQGIQTLNQPGYDGAMYTFVHERMNLAAYTGQAQFKFRFKLRSDSGYNLDGWYVDDIQVVGYTGTTAPSLDVVMTPLSPPINIPANGGSFQFNATVQRTQAPQTAFWAWARNRYPSGTYSGTLLGPVNINPPVGVTVTRTRTQVVDAAWSAGVNYYVGYAHSSVAYPATDADSFPWTKLATSDGGPMVWEASNYGEEFPYLVGGSSTPQSFALIGASPNPFNPTTAISYQLSANSFVSLKVYNTAGRLVSTLVNGVRDAGNHQVTFNGSNLASGVYLYSLTAGSNHATGKMVLMK